MSRYSRLFVLSKSGNDMVSKTLHHMKQFFFSGCLIVCDTSLHHMSGTIKFMALLQILPAVFRFFYNKKGIKIAIRLLCLFDDVNDLIRTRFQLIVRLYRKRIGDTL